MEIRYPKSVEEIPPERSEELERDIAHFLQFSPGERLCYVEEEWAAYQEFIRKFRIFPVDRSE